MINWLKWRIARKELEELERWRVHCIDLQRYLGEFPDIADTLFHLEAVANGFETPHVTPATIREKVFERMTLAKERT